MVEAINLRSGMVFEKDGKLIKVLEANHRIADKIVKAEILDSGDRRDHTPIMLEIDI